MVNVQTEQRSFKNSGNFFFFLMFLGFLLTGCSSTLDEKLEDQPVGQLYQKGMDLLKEKKYEKAAQTFDEVDRQHPYSEWATQAQIMSAYAHYQAQKYPKALAALETFISLHPAHKDIAYAYYLQGLCYYEQIPPIERDQQATVLAYDAFKELVNRFPTTGYAKDARYKLILLRNILATKEMDAGRYYQKRRAYVGALNRFRTVVKDYQETDQVPEALHRMVESYIALGLLKEAQMTAAVLGHNYPDNPWYADTYLLMKGKDFRPEENRGQGSWFEKAWKGTFGS